MKNRNYVFTINNPTKKNIAQLDKLGASLADHSYIIYGIETAPTTGTVHIQGYIQLLQPRPFLWLQKYFNLKHRNKLIRFWHEPAIGSLSDNKKYTSKSGDFREFGTPKEQGKRTDLSEIKEKILLNPKDLNKIVANDIQNYQQLKFAENLQKYFFKNRDVAMAPRVYWIYGSSGIGKTKLVYDSFDSICSVSDYQWLGTGYQQQECYLLDDFRSGDISFNTLLKLTDRYPYQVFFKGGSMPFNSPYIVITTPKNIKDTFGIMAETEELLQLYRRVMEIDLAEQKISSIKDINFSPTNKQLDDIDIKDF